MSSFFNRVWEWLKRYWKWLLFPIGILLLVIGWLSGRRINVVSPGSVAASDAARKAQELADKQAKDAEIAKQKRLEELKKEHEATIQKLTDEQKSKVDELRDDPDKLNEYLLDVGRQIRG